MLLVQKYLQNHTFGELESEHGVFASFSKSGRKFSLNYGQLEAKDEDLLAQECRGLILMASDARNLSSEAILENGRLTYKDVCPGSTVALAFPMRRFFNLNQGAAANIDWNDPNIRIMEKLDGTLVILYFDHVKNEWCAATRSVPEADLLMDNGLYTFRTLFEKSLKETTSLSFKEYSDLLNKTYTYCFELTTPLNRIVVNYPDYRVTLLAVRSISSFIELDIKDVDSFGVPKVKEYNFNNLNSLVDWVSSLNPSENEGVVVRNANFERIKIKNANYVAFSKMRESLGTSEKNCLEIILNEKEDDVIPFLTEEITENLLKIKEGLNKAIHKYDNIYLDVKKQNPLTKKDFALLITKDSSLWHAPFFIINEGKASSMKDFILKNKKMGSWGDSFLNNLLKISKNI